MTPLDGACGAYFVPKLLTKGVASDGREYDLTGFGDWIEEEKIDSLALYQSGVMTRRHVRSFWQWSGRTDRMPKTLTLYLSANPEFYRWTPLADVHKVLCSKINIDKKIIERELVIAFRNHVRTVCGWIEKVENGVRAHDIRVHTNDFIRWAALEYEVKIKLTDLNPGNDDRPSMLEILWPELVEDWPELNGEGNMHGLTKMY